MTNRKIRLAIVSNVAAPYRIAQHQRIVRELGNEVELWSIILYEHDWQPWQHELPPEIRPVIFGKGEFAHQKRNHPIRQWSKMGEVTRFLEENSIDVVIFTGVGDLGMFRLVAWCKRNAIPNFMFGDANVLGDKNGPIRQFIRNIYLGRVVKSVTGILPCGLRGKQFFEKYGAAGKPCFFMPHEPDYQRLFQISPAEVAAAQAKYGVDPQRNYFLFCGRLAAAKGIETLVDAFVAMADERPEWDLLIVGGGTLEGELRQRVPAALKDRIVWTGFVNDRGELDALFTSSQVFVLPSRYEPWGVVVCEAAAAGLAIITSDVVGASPELCHEGVNGGTFPVGDSAQLAKLMLRVSADADELAAMRCASLRVLDEWRRRGDPVQAVRLAMAHLGLRDEPSPVEPDPPTPQAPRRLVADRERMRTN